MAGVPEFLLKKLYQPGSLQVDPEGFSFVLQNNFAPATVQAFHIELDGQPVPDEAVSLQIAGNRWAAASEIKPEAPMAFSVGVAYTVRIEGKQYAGGSIRLRVDTREAGQIAFSLPLEEKAKRTGRVGGWRLPAWLQPAIQAELLIDAQAVIGQIQPYVYGHFIEHLERCIYDGIWTADGSQLRADTLKLIQELQPPLMRYPGGNFASGYHWEDGIGPPAGRPPRFDQAWQSWESNKVGTNEFLTFCRVVGAEPFLVVNDGSGDAEEAARWVAYCNQPADSEQGRRRATHGHPEPYRVRLWGVGNEVWGSWQIGHTGPEEYATRLKDFIQAMRASDANIRIVAVGDKVMSDSPEDAGRQWNAVVLAQAGDLIDELSFHLYQPDQEGWREDIDPQALHHILCAAPLDAEAAIRRMAAQIAECLPGRKIGIAFDEWNVWPAPPEGAGSMHQVNYTLREALYTAGMLNVFHRQARALSIANLAQLVNVLPAIATGPHSAYATPIYYPFWMYRHMQPMALVAQTGTPTYNSPELGNIPALQNVPYLDATATRDRYSQRLTIGLVNRHPSRRLKVKIAWQGFPPMQVDGTWLLSGPDPAAANSLSDPENVRARKIEAPQINAGGTRLVLPAAAVLVLALRSS